MTALAELLAAANTVPAKPAHMHATDRAHGTDTATADPLSRRPP